MSPSQIFPRTSSGQPERVAEFNPYRSGVLYIPIQFPPNSSPDPNISSKPKTLAKRLMSTQRTTSSSGGHLFAPPATTVNSSIGLICPLNNTESHSPFGNCADLIRDSQGHGTARELNLQRRISMRPPQLQEFVPASWNDSGFSGIKRGSGEMKFDSQVPSKKQKLGSDKNLPLIKSKGVPSSATLKARIRSGERGMSGIVKSTTTQNSHNAVRRVMTETKEGPVHSPLETWPVEKSKLPFPNSKIPVATKTLDTDITNPLAAASWLRLGIPPSPFKESLSPLNISLHQAWDTLQANAGNWTQYPIQSLLLIRLHLLSTLWNHVTSPNDTRKFFVAPGVCAQAIGLVDALLHKYGCEIVKRESDEEKKVRRRVFTFRLGFERGWQRDARVWNEILREGKKLGLIHLKKDEVALHMLAEKWERKYGATKDQGRVGEIKVSQVSAPMGIDPMILSESSASLFKGPVSVVESSAFGSRHSTRPSQLFHNVTAPATMSKSEVPEIVRITPTPPSYIAPNGSDATVPIRIDDLPVAGDQRIPKDSSSVITSLSVQRPPSSVTKQARAIAPRWWRPGTKMKTSGTSQLPSTMSRVSDELSEASRDRTVIPESQKADVSKRSHKRPLTQDNGTPVSVALRDSIELKRGRKSPSPVKAPGRESFNSPASERGIRGSGMPEDAYKEIVASNPSAHVAEEWITALSVQDRSDAAASTTKSSLPAQKATKSTMNNTNPPLSPSPPPSHSQPCPENSITGEAADASESRLAELKSQILQARPNCLRARAADYFEGGFNRENDHWGRLNHEKRSEKVDLSQLEEIFRKFTKE